MVDFSLEVYPPRSPGAYHSLQSAIGTLAALKPAFMTVTYGAGGSTRTQTRELVVELAKKYDFPIAAHLTCVGATRDDIGAIADEYWNSGIRRIVALRG